MIEYKLRPSFSVRGPIREIASRIEALKKKNATPEDPEGWTTPEEVIQDARDDASPLHGCFTWDVDEAAMKRWRDEARYLMRCYEVHVSEPDHQPILISPGSVRVIEPDRQSRFVSPQVAMARPDYRAQVLKESMDMLSGLEARLRCLRGISPTIIKSLAMLRNAIERDLARSKKKPAKVAN